jgi:hypothetical protein
MGTKPTSRAILVGRLMVIAPAMAAIPLVVFLGLRTFGPFLILYYVVTGIALGWQWYSIAVPRWREWLAKKEVHDSEVAHLVHRAGLVSPGGVGAVGLFALHTTTVALCSIFLAPRVGRWLAWLLTGSATMPGAGDYYLGAVSNSPYFGDWLCRFSALSEACNMGLDSTYDHSCL